MRVSPEAEVSVLVLALVQAASAADAPIQRAKAANARRVEGEMFVLIFPMSAAP